MPSLSCFYITKPSYFISLKQSTYVYNTVLQNLLVNALLRLEALCPPYASIVEITEKNIAFELNVQRKNICLKN